MALHLGVNFLRLKEHLRLPLSLTRQYAQAVRLAADTAHVRILYTAVQLVVLATRTTVVSMLVDN